MYIQLAMAFLLAAVTAVALDGAGPSRRVDLLKSRLLLTLLKRRPLQFVLQLPVVAVFFVAVAAGLFGAQRAGSNLATVLTWTVWWTGLMVAAVFIGKAWCMVCPWAAVGDWLQRLALWRKKDKILGLELKWPVGLRNLYPAVALFIVITWAEFRFHLVSRPAGTANLAIVTFLLAAAVALFYERRSFCRYLCPVGGMLGLYAMASAVELRARDRAVCRRCGDKDCVNGNDRGYGCPVFEYPESMDVNTYCILCTECVKTCPEDNIALSLRSPDRELTELRRTRGDEALFAVVIVGVVFFHSFTMIDLWFDWLGFATAAASLSAEAVATASLAASIAAVLIVYALFCVAAVAAGGAPGGRGAALGEVFRGFAYPLIPLAFFSHIAHNSMHILMEGPAALSVLADPFGTAPSAPAGHGAGGGLGLATVQDIQALILFAGLWISLRAAAASSAALGGRRAFVAQAMLIALLTLADGWILSQPMVMRMGM